MLREKRDVLVEELLKIFRAGGDDDSAAGENCGHEVRERLAGPGAHCYDGMLLSASAAATAP